MCVSSVMSGGHCLFGVPLLLHSTLTLGGGEGGVDEDIPFRTEHSKVSHSL